MTGGAWWLAGVQRLATWRGGGGWLADYWRAWVTARGLATWWLVGWLAGVQRVMAVTRLALEVDVRGHG